MGPIKGCMAVKRGLTKEVAWLDSVRESKVRFSVSFTEAMQTSVE